MKLKKFISDIAHRSSDPKSLPHLLTAVLVEDVGNRRRDVQRALHPLMIGGARALGGPGIRPQKKKKKEKKKGKKKKEEKMKK